MVLLGLAGETRAKTQQKFSLQAYEEFHDVLHPLEHEALPEKDFKRIRVKSGLLIRRGRVMVKGGVPVGPDVFKEEFGKALKKFDAALTKLSPAARRGTDEQLKTAFSAVHDSYEELMALLRQHTR